MPLELCWSLERGVPNNPIQEWSFQRERDLEIFEARTGY